MKGVQVTSCWWTFCNRKFLQSNQCIEERKLFDMEVLFLFSQSIIHLDLKYSRYKNPIYADFTKTLRLTFFIIFSSPSTGWVIWAAISCHLLTRWQGNTGRQLFIEPIHWEAEKKLIKLKWCHKALRYWEQIDCCRLYKHKHWRLIIL